MVHRALAALCLLVAATSRAAGAEVVFSAQGAWAPAPPPPGGSATVIVTVLVDQGWHVNSHTPLDEFLIPTDVRLELPPGWRAEPPVFPAHRLVSLSFSETPVAVLEGEFVVRVRVHAAAAGQPVTELAGVVEAQACDDRQCMAPEEVRFTVTGSVAAGGEDAGATGGTPATAGGLSQRFLSGGLLLQLALVFVGGLALNLTPGADMMFCLGQGLKSGWRPAMAANLGSPTPVGAACAPACWRPPWPPCGRRRRR